MSTINGPVKPRTIYGTEHAYLLDRDGKAFEVTMADVAAALNFAEARREAWDAMVKTLEYVDETELLSQYSKKKIHNALRLAEKAKAE